MDAIEADPNAMDVEDEIATTAKLIQKLSDAKQSLGRQRNIVLEASDRIWREINTNQDDKLLSRIDHLRIQIVSLHQFPHNPPYYYRIITRKLPVKTQEEEAEEAIRSINHQLHRNDMNLATERRIGRELQQRQRKLQEQRDHHADDSLEQKLTNSLTNPHYSTHYWVRYKLYNGVHFVRVNLSPTQNIRRLIMIWTDKIQDVYSQILRDSKRSDPTSKTRDKLLELAEFGTQFYRQVEVGREEFKRLWDSMKDTKRSIAHIESELIKIRNRHERGCTKVKRLQEKSVVLDKKGSEIWGRMRSISHEKVTLEMKMKETYQLQVTHMA